jgi:hypothetical protein
LIGGVLRSLIEWERVWEGFLVLEVDLLRLLQLFSWVYSRMAVDISMVISKLAQLL